MPRCRFGRGVKLAVVKRMLASENVKALSRELKVTRKTLYDWRGKFPCRRSGGVAGPSQPRKLVAVEPRPRQARLRHRCRRMRRFRRHGSALSSWSARSPGSSGSPIFSQCLATSQGKAPAEQGARCQVVCALITALATPGPQGTLSVERTCALAGVSSAGYYRRHFQAPATRQEATCVCDPIQAPHWRTATTATGGSPGSCSARAADEP
jgi:transposase-like protein